MKRKSLSRRKLRRQEEGRFERPRKITSVNCFKFDVTRLTQRIKREEICSPKSMTIGVCVYTIWTTASRGKKLLSSRLLKFTAEN